MEIEERTCGNCVFFRRRWLFGMPCCALHFLEQQEIKSPQDPACEDYKRCAAGGGLQERRDMRYRVELAIVGLLVLAPFVVGLLAGFRWVALAAGLVLVALLIGLAHLWGVVVKALKKGGDGGDGAAWAGDNHRQG